MILRYNFFHQYQLQQKCAEHAHSQAPTFLFLPTKDKLKFLVPSLLLEVGP